MGTNNFRDDQDKSKAGRQSNENAQHKIITQMPLHGEDLEKETQKYRDGPPQVLLKL